MVMNVQVAQTLLRRGFSAPGSGPIDIFGVAAAVAAGLPLHLPLNTDCLLASLDRVAHVACVAYCSTHTPCCADCFVACCFCYLCPGTLQLLADTFEQSL